MRFLLISRRAIITTRLLTGSDGGREISRNVGAAFYITLGRIFFLVKLGHQPPLEPLGVYRFAFEAFLQLLLDMKQLCFNSSTTSSTDAFDISPLTITWAVAAISLDAAYCEWESDITCRFLTSASNSTGTTLVSKVGVRQSPSSC